MMTIRSKVAASKVPGRAIAPRRAALLLVALGALATTAGASVSPARAQAGPGLTLVQAERGMTKAQFIERQQQKAMQQGQNPDQAAARAAQIFDMIDTNHDGVMTRTEVAAFKAAHPGMAAHGPGQMPQ